MDAFSLNGQDFDDANLSLIQEYLERGGDPDFQFYGGVTLFIKAICYPFDNFTVIRELINAGADVNRRTHTDTTPLILAVRYRKRNVVKELIQAGASVNAKDFVGSTVLHHAVGTCILNISPRIYYVLPDIRIVEDLLKWDMDCNQADFYGSTPLLLAVHNRQITRLLLRFHANPNIGNELSETPLHVAFSQPENDAEIELLLFGASIYSVDKRGRTPLDVLIENGLGNRNDIMLNTISKVIAINYCITSDLKQKLELVPRLSQVFKRHCKEANHMTRDFIYGNITMHDFMYGCFIESDSDIHLIQKPVVERLVRNIYPEYCSIFLSLIQKSSLRKILQMTAEENSRVKDLVYLFSITDINRMISKYLSRDQIFDLIRTFSDATISE